MGYSIFIVRTDLYVRLIRTAMTDTDIRGSAVVTMRTCRRLGSRKDTETLPYSDDMRTFLREESRRLAPATIRHYDHIIRYVTKVLTDAGMPSDPRTIDRKALGVLQDHFDQNGVSTATQRTYFQSLSAYCRYYGNDAVRKARLVWSKPMQRNVDWLSMEQLTSLTNAITDPMIRCAVMLMSYGCLRRVECIRLRRTDVDYVRKTIRVTGKGHRGGKIRYIPMAEPVETALRRWDQKRYRMVCDWEDRHPGDISVPDTVFIGIDAHDVLKSYSEAGTGWDKHVMHPVQRYAREVLHTTCSNHTFRRTMARSWWQNGVPVETVSALLGHASPEITMQYIGIRVDDIASAMATALSRIEGQYGQAFH